MVLSISLGMVYSLSWQKLISMLIYLKKKVMMGTLALVLVESCRIYGLSESFLVS